MATRSYILRKEIDNSYSGIYCHFDGYPEHNGKILDDHYTDPMKVRSLLSLGSISYLEKNPDQCEILGDDAVFFENRKELMKSILGLVDYVYVFLPDNKWEIISNSKSGRFMPIEY